MNYEIVRFFRDKPNEVIVQGLTHDQAVQHCRSLESSSATCTTEEGIARTRRDGPWFDGYRETEASTPHGHLMREFGVRLARDQR